MSMTLEDAITTYKQLIETSDQALPMLVVDVVGEGPYLYALTTINEEIRPSFYIRLVAEQLANEGKAIDQMILQDEAWLRVFTKHEGETGMSEVAAFTRYGRDGKAQMVAIQFTRLGDGSVTWRDRTDVPGDQLEGDVIDAMREVIR